MLTVGSQNKDGGNNFHGKSFSMENEMKNA
jgi:hypothetical protein